MIDYIEKIRAEAIYPEEMELLKQDLRNCRKVNIRMYEDNKDKTFCWKKATVSAMYPHHVVFDYKVRNNPEKQSFTYVEMVMLVRKYGWSKVFGG